MATKTSSHVLTDHDEIRRWAEEREAKPACVRSTGDDNDIGMIRLDFPGYSGEDSLEEVSWDEWFDKFDESGLALVVQEETANGQRSNFNKLVSRDSVEETSSKKKTSARASTGRSAATRDRSAQGSSTSASSGSRKKAASSGSRASHASGTAKQSSRSGRRESSREEKPSRRNVA